MKNYFFALAVLVLTFGLSQANVAAQRKSVSGAEVTGTFQMAFKGKYKGSSNEIKIQALGKGKLKVSFDLIYPYTLANGDLMANTGIGDGEATIEGDTAVFESSEYGECKITFKFTKPGTIVVTQEGASGCGFGHNVTAAGTYRKTSSKKPNFDRPEM